MRNARGALTVRVASPGLIEGKDANPAPASHMNFVIANGAVIAPVYEARTRRFASTSCRPLPRSAP